MKLFYFKEKSTTPLLHGKNIKNRFQRKHLFVGRFLRKWKYSRIYENKRTWGKHIQNDERFRSCRQEV